jgi:hypothetical protein
MLTLIRLRVIWLDVVWFNVLCCVFYAYIAKCCYASKEDGHYALRITTTSINDTAKTTHSTMTLSIITLSTRAFRITTPSINDTTQMALSILTIIQTTLIVVTLSTMTLSLMTLSILILSNDRKHYYIPHG